MLVMVPLVSEIKPGAFNTVRLPVTCPGPLRSNVPVAVVSMTMEPFRVEQEAKPVASAWVVMVVVETVQTEAAVGGYGG